MKHSTVPDLTNCDTEPIHFIGSIQSVGYLLVLDKSNMEIVQASENIYQLLDFPAKEIIGSTIDQFFPGSFLEHLHELVHPEGPAEHHSMSFEHKKEIYVLSTHLSDDFLVLEMEKDDEQERRNSYFHYSNLVENALYYIDQHDSIDEICSSVIDKLRSITGFNRLMVYRFDENDHGEVIAESGEENLTSYLGLKFPSADIPAQARRLYLKNMIRGIWNIDDDQVQVYPVLRSRDKKALDMTQCFLRSVSPVHIHYLRNMAVRASFSISLVVKDRLWGLILCHHTDKPVKLNFHQRRACQFVGRILSQKIESKTEDHQYSDYRHQLKTMQKIVSGFIQSGDLHESLETHKDLLLEVLGADGYALRFDDRLSYNFTSLRNEWLRELSIAVNIREENVFCTDNISGDFPRLNSRKGDPAGIMAIKLSQHLDELLLIFKKEQVQEVHWAGKPGKDADGNDDVKVLSPRHSFEKWTELVQGQSGKWRRDDRQFAEELRIQLIENIISMNNDSQRMHQQDRNKLRLRLIERNYELEQENRRLTEELRDYRKNMATQRMARDIVEEKHRLRVIASIRK